MGSECFRTECLRFKGDSIETLNLMIQVTIPLATCAGIALTAWYRSQNVGLISSAVATLAFSLGVLSVLLVAYDLSSPGEELQLWWRVVYWSQFLLSLIFIPYLIMYEQNTHLGTDRLLTALKDVLRLYSYYLLAGAVGVALVIGLGTGIDFVNLAMVVGTSWGLLQLSVFMGYGLVGLP